MWDEIIAEPQYEDYDLYATGVATGFYARGIAYASMGMVAEAEEEQVRGTGANESLGKRGWSLFLFR